MVQNKHILYIGFLALFLSFINISFAHADNYIDKPHKLLPKAGVCVNSDVNTKNLRKQQKAILCLVNKIRVSQKRQPLKSNKLLHKSSNYKANNIAKCKRFSHTPCGEPFIQSFQKSGYKNNKRFGSMGENIAMSWDISTPREVVNDWMNSSGHRKNILDPKWEEMGLYLKNNIDATKFKEYKDFGKDVSIWVQQFGVIKKP